MTALITMAGTLLSGSIENKKFSGLFQPFDSNSPAIAVSGYGEGTYKDGVRPLMGEKLSKLVGAKATITGRAFYVDKGVFGVEVSEAWVSSDWGAPKAQISLLAKFQTKYAQASTVGNGISKYTFSMSHYGGKVGNDSVYLNWPCAAIGRTADQLMDGSKYCPDEILHVTAAELEWFVKKDGTPGYSVSVKNVAPFTIGGGR